MALETYYEKQASQAMRQRLAELRRLNPPKTETKKRRLPLYEWCQKYLPHYFYRPANLLHEWLSEELTTAAEKRGVKIVAEGPRGSAKSTVTTLGYPLYAICEGFEQYILLCSDSSDQADKYLESIKQELEENDLIKADYPHVFGKGPRWKATGIKTRNGVRVESLGAGKKIRGRKNRQHRPSCVVVDDPDSDDAAYSSIIRERIRDWFLKGVEYVGSPTTNFFVIGTRIHSECLTAHLSRQAGWRFKAFKAIMSWPTRMDLWNEWERIYCDLINNNREQDAKAFYEKRREDMDAGAQVLWESHKTLYDLMTQRASTGHTAFESESQNNPIDPSKCEWGPENFEGDIWFDEWPTNYEVKVMSLDPSKGVGDKPGDYSAILKVAKIGPLFYVEADLIIADITRVIERVLESAAVFQPEAIGVESDMFQFLIANEMIRLSGERGMPAPVVPITTRNVKKEIRIRRLGPYLAMRAFRFKKRSAGTTLLVRQMQEFPNGQNDDGPDGLEISMRILARLLGAADSADSN